MQQTIIRPAKELDQLSNVLNKQVANLNVLFVKLHHFHWYVKGPHFFALHEKFEQLYSEVAEHMDEVAERLLTIGGKPCSTMKQHLQDTSLEEATGGENEQQMVQTTHDDLSMITQELAQGMEVAESMNDQATSDILLAIKSSFEKSIWMLRAFLGD